MRADTPPLLGTSWRLHTPQGPAGHLTREAGQYVFNYDTTDPGCALSLNMPLRARSYVFDSLPPVLAMHLPEGAQRTRLASQSRSSDDMALLSVTAGASLGRVLLTAPGATEQPLGPQIGLKALVASKASPKMFQALQAQFGVPGLSGTQPKVLIANADRASGQRDGAVLPPQLIVKAAAPDYPSICANEFICLDAARRAGIPVPDCWLSEDGGLLMVERFDLAEDGTRYGFEDIAVLSQRTYDRDGDYRYDGSYEGMVSLIEVFSGHHSVAACQAFFASWVLHCMVRNGDAHLKDFGLLYDAPDRPDTVRLAPLYDVVTTAAYDQPIGSRGRTVTDRSLALRFRKSYQYPTRQEMLAFAPRCFVRQPEQLIERIGVAMGEALRAQHERFPRAFFKRLHQEWDDGRKRLEVG